MSIRVKQVEGEEENETSIWKPKETMVSITLGRAMSTLLSSHFSTKHLLHSLSHLSPHKPPSSSSPPGSALDDSLLCLHANVKDASVRGETLDDVLLPIIDHYLRNRDTKRGVHAVILINWLFQDELLFQDVAKNLADIIVRKDDRYVAFGWCLLVRTMVEYESSMEQYTLNGICDNYNALLEILCSCIPHLCSIVVKGSTLQDGSELPSRLAMGAADCILSITESLTKKSKVSTDSPKSSKSKVSNQPVALVPATSKRPQKPTSELSDTSNVSSALLLWNEIKELITLLQKIHAWNKKSRPLHAKGAEQVLKWLQEINRYCSSNQDEAVILNIGENIPKTQAMLLSSCWKRYSSLLHLEDRKFSQRCNDLLEQYLSGIQYYTENIPEGHPENQDGAVETRKFFLNCLSLILGRFDKKKFESTMSEKGMQISRILLSQFYSADEDVVAVAVCIFKEIIFRAQHPSGSGVVDSMQIDTVLPLLLEFLDERDGAARAVVLLVAEYCSMSKGSDCLAEVLKRLSVGNVVQRRNAIDVISELVSSLSSSDSVTKVSQLAWKEIANKLLEMLADEDVLIREQASNLIPMVDPLLTLPALVHRVSSSEDGVQFYAKAAFMEMLKYHNQKPEVICLLLDCLSDMSRSGNPGGSTEVTEAKKDIDRILKLIPEWSNSVQDWNTLVGPLIEKMFAEPENAIIVRFLSMLSEHLAKGAATVLHHVLVRMKGQKDVDAGSLARWEKKFFTSDDLVKMQQSLFERLSPLLILRLLPLKVFDDLSSSIVYGQLLDEVVDHGDVSFDDHECVAAFLLKRALGTFEFDDVRKLAAELCGRIHPKVLFPVISSQLQNAASSSDVLKVKSSIFAVCTSLVVRGREAISHPSILEIRRTLEIVLSWPSLDGDEVSKVQHGCIDCLALMICAELQTLKDSGKKFYGVSEAKNSASGTLSYVIDNLVNDKSEVSSSTFSRGNFTSEALIHLPFRLCMANVLISACQKLSDSTKKAFAKRTIPLLIHSVQLIEQVEIRAACVQVLFSAVYHLKLAILPYASNLLKLSLKVLTQESEKERMAGTKLLTSLMASEDSILESIAQDLVEARAFLSNMPSADPSHR